MLAVHTGQIDRCMTCSANQPVLRDRVVVTWPAAQTGGDRQSANLAMRECEKAAEAQSMATERGIVDLPPAAAAAIATIGGGYPSLYIGFAVTTDARSTVRTSPEFAVYSKVTAAATTDSDDSTWNSLAGK